MRVVLIRAGALGDLLLLRPALHALARAGRSITLIAPKVPAAVFHGTVEIDELVAWDGPEIAGLLGGSAAASALAERLRSAERVIAYSRSNDLLLALEHVGAPARMHDPSPPPGRHAGDWLCEPAVDLVGSSRQPPPPIEASAQEQREADALLRQLPAGFLAVHPGSGAEAKNWPAKSFRQLVEQRSAAAAFLLVRGPADAAACSDLARHPRAVLADALPLRVLGAVLAKAGLYVGNDSGISHLAAAFGAPVLVLFGPTDARSWRPVGSRVRTLSSGTGAMTGVSVEEVVAATSDADALPSG